MKLYTSAKSGRTTLNNRKKIKIKLKLKILRKKLQISCETSLDKREIIKDIGE